MEHLALRGCFQHRGIFTKVYVRLVWIRNFKILNRDQYVRIFFYYANFFSSYFLQNILIIVINIFKNILTLFMLHHTILLSNRLPISNCYPLPKGRFVYNTHLSATENTTRMLLIWLACVKHVANVHLELGHHLILA